MSEDSIDYVALEKMLKENSVAIGPGVPCEICSSVVPKNFKFGKTVYHPMGREHHQPSQEKQAV